MISSFILSKNSGNKLIPQEQPNQNKEMKIADSVLLNLFMRDNEKCNISDATFGIFKFKQSEFGKIYIYEGHS